MKAEHLFCRTFTRTAHCLIWLSLLFSDEEEWEAEVEEEDSLVEEFREVWHLSHTVTTLDDTGDSLDNDDSEQIRVGLHVPVLKREFC